MFIAKSFLKMPEKRLTELVLRKNITALMGLYAKKDPKVTLRFSKYDPENEFLKSQQRLGGHAL